jgi:hypothetical protein
MLKWHFNGKRCFHSLCFPYLQESLAICTWSPHSEHQEPGCLSKWCKRHKRSGLLSVVHTADVKVKCLCWLHFPSPALLWGWWRWWHSLSRRPAEHGKSLSTAHKRHTLKTLLAGGVKLVKVLQRLGKWKERAIITWT